jgi:acetyl esterase/lipase
MAAMTRASIGNVTSVASELIERDLVYATVGEMTLELDLYRAPQADAPVVLYAHGGGWRSGDKADGANERLAPLAAHGVTVASVNYRLVPHAAFPEQVHDLKGAIRWLRARGSSLGLPTARIGIWGASAGAYLGSLVALTAGADEFEGTVGGNTDESSAVQAVVHWFGQADLLAAGSRTGIEARLLPFAFEAGLLGVNSVVETADRARGLSLLNRVSGAAPPFLIAHGDRDHVVAPSESEALHDALSRAGADSQFMLLGGAGHEGPEFDRPANLALTAAWLRAQLLSPTARVSPVWHQG